MRKFLLMLLITLLTLPALAGAAAAESTYDRVARTRTLRCAYTAYPALVTKDPQTNELHGLFYDLVEEMGKRLELKIEWVEEVSSDQMGDGLKAGRYDAVCSGHIASPQRAWAADYTKPLIFVPIYVYVRADENRFHDLSDLDNSSARVITLEGRTGQTITNNDFPRAQIRNIPLITSFEQRIDFVISNQADAIPLEPFVAAEYMARHPGKIKLLGTKPFRMPPASIVIPTNEPALKSLLDTTIEYMLWKGTVNKILKEHERFTGAMYIPVSAAQPVPVSIPGEK